MRYWAHLCGNLDLKKKTPVLRSQNVKRHSVCVFNIRIERIHEAKKYTQLILTLFFLNILVNVNFSQVSDGYKTPFLGHWVNVNYDREDTVLYLPYNSEQVQKMKPEFKQAGITLKEQDLCYLHFWQWCGNGHSGASLYQRVSVALCLMR